MRRRPRGDGIQLLGNPFSRNDSVPRPSYRFFLPPLPLPRATTAIARGTGNEILPTFSRMWYSFDFRGRFVGELRTSTFSSNGE
mmetsp:Transcript_612/g.1194  ORF Transcript_612/g.1194 Transcript_612/m.1194 type:complete len:84 (+) Transcript_612:507-758(+)